MVTLEESFHGSMRTISLRKADPRTGRVVIDEESVMSLRHIEALRQQQE